MAGFQKNVASQKWLVFAFDETDNTAKAGDAANITGKVRKDYGAANAITDTNPTEIEDGYYEFDLSQAETNADVLDILPESGTANIQVIGCSARVFTVPPNFSAIGIESDGHVHGDVKELAGSTIQQSGGRPEVNLSHLMGTILTESVGGYLAAAFIKLFDVETPALTAASVDQTGDAFTRLGAPAGASLAADVAANLASIQGVSNVTRLSVGIPKYLDRPSAGNKAVKIEFALKDTDGNMEDSDNNVLAVQLYNTAATDRSGLLYKEAALTNALDVGSGTFSGYKQLERSATGLYACFVKIASDATEEELFVKCG